jgi:hypothetical protein
MCGTLGTRKLARATSRSWIANRAASGGSYAQIQGQARREETQPRTATQEKVTPDSAQVRNPRVELCPGLGRIRLARVLLAPDEARQSCAAGTGSIQYRCAAAKTVCYSLLRTRVPPNGFRATAPARPSPEASRLPRWCLRRRPATSLALTAFPNRLGDFSARSYTN